MTGDSGMRSGESRRLPGSTGPDDGTPRPREVAVGAGLGGFAAIVLLVVSALLSGGGGRHTAAVVRPGTSGDGPAGVTVASPSTGDASGQDAKNAIATAVADTPPLGPLETNLQLTAAGAPSAPDPAKTTTAQAKTGMHSSEPPAPKARPLTAPPAVAVSPPAGPEPVPTAGTAELAAGNDPSSGPASPQPEPSPLCREDSDFAGSLLRSLGLASCTP
jgi:hypothetical protein